MRMFGKRMTLAEQAATTMDRIQTDIADLQVERQAALSCFRCTADRLAVLDEYLGEKAALCGSLVAQLTQAQEDIAKQVSDNERVRGKILDIIGD